MKILFEGHTFSQDHGGISRMWNRLLPLVADIAPDISVTLMLRLYRTRSAPRHPRMRRITNVEDTRLGRLNPLFERLTALRCQAVGPDIFHAMSYAPSPFAGVRVLQTVYDCMHEAFPAVTGNPAFSLRKRNALADADRILAISHATKSEVVRHFRVPEERIDVMPLAADPLFSVSAAPDAIAQMRGRFGLDRPYVLYVGNRGNYKNFFTLLHAYGASGIAAETDLVAVGGEPELRHTENEYIIGNRLESRVRLLPKVPDSELHLLYSDARAFVYPSLMEGFGIPLLEAMGAGCPALASDIGAFQEIGAHPEAMFDPHDPEPLALLLQRIGRDESWRRMLISHGKTVAARFTWKRSARRLIEVYHKMKETAPTDHPNPKRK